MKDSRFYRQADLLVRSIPAVAAEKCFALKGGTAINLFVRDMPRLSVDIDLAYVPVQLRSESLQAIEAALWRISGTLKETLKAEVVESLGESKRVTRLFVRSSGVQIIIEPSINNRGTVFGCEERQLVNTAETLFERAVSINTVSLADLYGGKICAALDRQHPRDLFDVKLLFENEGITTQIRQAVVVLLASHARPMSELIDPPRKDVRELYESHFRGMTSRPVQYEDLTTARERQIGTLRSDLTEQERQFLISIQQGAADWTLLDIKGIDQLPGVRFKLQNVAKMEAGKRDQSVAILRQKLGL